MIVGLKDVMMVEWFVSGLAAGKVNWRADSWDHAMATVSRVLQTTAQKYKLMTTRTWRRLLRWSRLRSVWRVTFGWSIGLPSTWLWRAWITGLDWKEGCRPARLPCPYLRPPLSLRIAISLRCVCWDAWNAVLDVWVIHSASAVLSREQLRQHLQSAAHSAIEVEITVYSYRHGLASAAANPTVVQRVHDVERSERTIIKSDPVV
jgi:hypothetical protein